MATATLKKPRRLNIEGTIYEKGVATPVDDETAASLSQDKRFEVSGEFVPATADKARIKSIAAQIRDAADQLGADDAAYLGDGRASAKAISKVVGQKVTQHQVDNALGIKKSEEKPADDASKSSEKPKGKITVVKKAPSKGEKPTAEAAPASAEGPAPADKAAVDEVDPSTEGAI